MRRLTCSVMISLALLLACIAAPRADGLSDKIALCTTCHGASGIPTQADIPVIFGQQFYYLYVQLKDYKSGLRANAIMNGIAATLTKEEMQQLAEHFSKQTWPKIEFTAGEADIASARSSAAAGMCTQCHLGGFVGDSRVPRLAGQQTAYLERTMLEFKNKVRLNAPAMGSLFGDFDDAQISALAHYLAGY